MFDPRQRQQGGPPPWMQGLQQGLAAQRPMPVRPMPGPQGQGQLPPGMPPQGQGMPPQGMPQGGPPGGGFLRDQDAVIRAALARRGRPMPVAPQGGQPLAMPGQGAPEPDADQHGGPPDGDMDDPRRQMMGGGYR